MKSILYSLSVCLILLLVLFGSCSSMPDLSPQPSYQIVFDIEGISDELFIRANEWAVETFNNAESVIQFSDKQAGIIKGKYYSEISAIDPSSMSMGVSQLWQVYTIITVETRDNRARITFSDPKAGVLGTNGMGQRLPQYDQPVRDIYSQPLADKLTTSWENLAENFNSRMKTFFSDW